MRRFIDIISEDHDELFSFIPELNRTTDPKWHPMKHLPEYFQHVAQNLGRVFRDLTDTPIDDIRVLTTVGDINPKQDVIDMMKWIGRNGARDHSANFSHVMPSDTVSLWHADDHSFLLLRDSTGYSIFSWDSDDHRTIKT